MCCECMHTPQVESTNGENDKYRLAFLSKALNILAPKVHYKESYVTISLAVVGIQERHQVGGNYRQ